MITSAKNPTDYVRGLVRSAFWNMFYHQKAIRRVAANIVFARELAKRAGLGEELPDVDDIGEDEDYASFEQYAAAIVNEPASALEHHEEELRKAHNEIALTQILVARCQFTEEEVNLDALREEARLQIERSA